MNGSENHGQTIDAGVTAGEMTAAVNGKMVEFCRLLRHYGFQPGLGESQDALKIADCFLCTDFLAFQAGLRSLFCCGQGEQQEFDRLFEAFWCAADGASRIDATTRRRRDVRTVKSGGIPLTTGLSGHHDSEEQDRTTSGASDLQQLQRLDFTQIDPVDQGRLDLLALRMWRRMSLNRARRLRGRQWRKRIDFRRTMRRNLSRGGDPVELILQGRKPKKPRLVILLDVSGSMELYSIVFLRLLFALQKQFRRVSSFAFSTELVDITFALRARKLERALAAVSQLNLGWNGGTRIGESLQRLIDEHGQRVFHRDCVLIVLSDGLDVGPPERLAEALREVRGRVNKIIWLNPLLGMDGYEPTAGGMAAALPLLDVFASGHNLQSFLDIEKFLAA